MKTFTPRFDVLPEAQLRLWPELKPIQDSGFVLYGGTAIALRLGHRVSVDFDFFGACEVNREHLRETLPFLAESAVLQDKNQTFEVLTKSGVKVSFFGGLKFGRVGMPSRTEDGVSVVASLDDLMAHKVKVILQRSQAKDYQDIAAMARDGVDVSKGMASAELLFDPSFPIHHSIRALTYFEDGDLGRLSIEDRRTLFSVASKIKAPLPDTSVEPGLIPSSHFGLNQKLLPLPIPFSDLDYVTKALGATPLPEEKDHDPGR